jgi:AcrR family transcriptional regulator
MPRDARQTRRRILDAAYREFRRKGFVRVNVDEIAAASRVTKRTLYSHFRSKDDLLAAAFQLQIELASEAKQHLAREAVGSTAEQIVESWFAVLRQWSGKSRWSGSGFTRVAMELADLPGHPARALARRHKSIMMADLARKLADVGVESPQERVREIWMLVEGAMVMILIQGDQSYATTAAEAAKRLIGAKSALAGGGRIGSA